MRPKRAKMTKNGHFWAVLPNALSTFSNLRFFLEQRPMPEDGKQSALHAQPRKSQSLGPNFCKSKKGEKTTDLTGDFTFTPKFA